MNGANWEMSPQSAAAFRDALKRPLLEAAPLAPGAGTALLDRAAVEELLPHRAPFIFIDRIMVLDLQRGLIGACYDLDRSADVLAGHFPGRPLWPGVLHVEAIAEAGIILYLLMQGRGSPAPEARGGTSQVSMTHIAAARFMRPVTPGVDVEITARVFEDGFFFTVVGQCLRAGEICSAAAVNILLD